MNYILGRRVRSTRQYTRDCAPTQRLPCARAGRPVSHTAQRSSPSRRDTAPVGKRSWTKKKRNNLLGTSQRSFGCSAWMRLQGCLPEYPCPSYCVSKLSNCVTALFLVVVCEKQDWTISSWFCDAVVWFLSGCRSSNTVVSEPCWLLIDIYRLELSSSSFIFTVGFSRN